MKFSKNVNKYNVFHNLNVTVYSLVKNINDPFLPQKPYLYLISKIVIRWKSTN